MPSKGFLRIGQIVGDKKKNVCPIIPVSATTWWEGVRTGRYPKPIKLGPKITVWKAQDISKLIDELGNPESPSTTSEPADYESLDALYTTLYDQVAATRGRARASDQQEVLVVCDILLSTLEQAQKLITATVRLQCASSGDTKTHQELDSPKILRDLHSADDAKEGAGLHPGSTNAGKPGIT